jgi:hypothetical protein
LTTIDDLIPDLFLGAVGPFVEAYGASYNHGRGFDDVHSLGYPLQANADRLAALDVLEPEYEARHVIHNVVNAESGMKSS